MEQWAQIRGYEGLYDVSDSGNVRSWLSRRAGNSHSLASTPTLMKLKREPSGYLRVGLRKGGEVKYESVHVLVLETFVGSRPGDPRNVHGAHNDGDPSNNALTNLEWKTVTANHADKKKHGTDFQGERNPAATLNKSQVIEIKRRLQAARWGDVSRLAKEFGVDQTTISDIKTGRSWTNV